MDDHHKGIDLDAPLLSIRRFSSSVDPPGGSSPTPSSNSGSKLTTKVSSRRSSLPFYKPDLKSGPVQRPGVIPFVWEQRPGQPKPASPSRPLHVVAPPKPPPAKMGSSVRTRRPAGYASPVKEVEVKDPCFEEFGWPGNEGLEERKEKFEEEERFEEKSENVISNGNHTNQEIEKDNKLMKEENEKEKEIQKEEQEQKQKQKQNQNQNQNQNFQNQNQNQNQMQEEFDEESDDEEDDFSDALDTLSRSESCFMNCSVSGLSELPSTPAKQSPLPGGGGDPDAREFMIGRFLPAAQAVATGSPQYTFRKAPGPPKELMQHITGTGVNPNQRRVPVPLPFQHQPKYENNFEEEEEEEDEDEDDEEFEEKRRFYAKGCGFLPSFCVKSSLMMMNPMAGVKGRGKVAPPPPCGGVGGGGRRRGSPLIRSSINGSDSKRSDEAFENYLHSWEPVYKHKQDQRSTNSSTKFNESSSKNIINSETSHPTFWSDSLCTGGGSSPFIHSTGDLHSPPFPASNGDDHSSSKDSRLNSLERMEESRSSPDRFLDAQESNPSEAAPSATEDQAQIGAAEVHNKVPSIDMKDHKLPAQLLPLPLPKSPTESWLSRTLPSVSNKKQPVQSFLGMPVQQNRKQGLREEEVMKPSRPRQIRFCEVLEKPASRQSEI